MKTTFHTHWEHINKGEHCTSVVSWCWHTRLLVTAREWIPLTWKVKWSLNTPWMARRRRGGILLLFLNSALEGGEWSAWRLNRYFPLGEKPGTYFIGRWLGPRGSLYAEARGEILFLCLGSNRSRPVRSQALYWLSYTSCNSVKERLLLFSLK
jgi:hypothetical protein